MRRSLTSLTALLLALGTAGCDYYYNDVPSPDDLMHVVPWFDAMIKSPAVHPYETAAVPRNTVPGTVPITGGEADWSAMAARDQQRRERVSELLATGAWSGTGVLGPEAFDAVPFLDLLAEYGSPHGISERDPQNPQRPLSA